MPSARGSLIAAALAPVLFVAFALAAGFAQPGYSHVSDHLSGLAAVPATSRTVMTLGFVVLGVGVSLVGLAIARVERTRLVPATVLGAGVAIVALGLFPRDCVAVACTDPSWHHRTHDAASVPAYLLAGALPLIVAATSVRLPASRRAAALAAGATGLMLATFASGVFDQAGGLLQRLAVLPPLLWITTVSSKWARGVDLRGSQPIRSASAASGSPLVTSVSPTSTAS